MDGGRAAAYTTRTLPERVGHFAVALIRDAVAIWSSFLGRESRKKELTQMIDDDKMYSIKELSADSGWSRDSIKRRIKARFLKAVVLPRIGGFRNRGYDSCRVRGREWRRFLDENTI